MAKRPVKKTSPADKKIAALVKRIEALENQGFAQKLLIDELESNFEQMLNNAAQNNPFQSMWPSLQPPPLGSGRYYHACQAGHPDALGNAMCIICGKHQYTITTTVTSDSTISLGTRISPPIPNLNETSTSTEIAPDSFEILWEE